MLGITCKRHETVHEVDMSQCLKLLPRVMNEPAYWRHLDITAPPQPVPMASWCSSSPPGKQYRRTHAMIDTTRHGMRRCMKARETMSETSA